MNRLRVTRRLVRAAWTDLLDGVLGSRCHITGDRTFPADRRTHHDTQHPTEGPCA